MYERTLKAQTTENIQKEMKDGEMYYRSKYNESEEKI